MPALLIVRAYGAAASRTRSVRQSGRRLAVQECHHVAERRQARGDGIGNRALELLFERKDDLDVVEIVGAEIGDARVEPDRLGVAKSQLGADDAERTFGDLF